MTPCPSCGRANPEAARFCAECGKALVASPTTHAPAAGGAAPAGAEARREVRKTVTVLFTDVVGSTSLNEHLDPEVVRALMNRYFAVIQRVIEAHGGTVEKFIGDAVMAVFGIPIVHEDDALRGVRAAAEIRTELAALDLEVRAARGLGLVFRTGINTGLVVAGDPMSGQRFATGDTINTAARLETAAPPGEILLGHLTWQLVRDAVRVEPVEPIAAKGKAEPLRAYRLIAVDPAAVRHVRSRDTPLVGREPELATLRHVYQEVARERVCRLVTLLGGAGVGKSRLTADFTASLDPEATVLRGRCLSYGEGITYWPIGEIVRSAAHIGETDTADDARAQIRTRLEGQTDADLLTARIAAAIGLSTDAAPREEVSWAIRKFLEEVAKARSLVVVIEDIHWAEPALLDLLVQLVDLGRNAPILLLCPARPELLDAREAWGASEGATTLLLEPLGGDATSRLIAALPGGSGLPAALQARISAAAEGNPLFVEELLGMLVDDGLLWQTAHGAWQAADGLSEIRIPASISALLSARLERLPANELDVAERASVVGRVFEQSAVTELAIEGLRAEVGPSIAALVRKEFVRPEPADLSPGDVFKFRHILIRDAAYGALPKAERAILHERFAAWLERRSSTDQGEYELIVGYHLEQAYRYRNELGDDRATADRLAERALAYIAPAGRAARARGDAHAAASLLRRAVDLCPPGTQRIDLLLDLRRALRSAGEPEASDATDAEAVALLTRYPDEGLEHRRRLTEALFTLQATIPEARTAYEYYERVGDQMGMIHALEVAFIVHAYRGHFTAALEQADHATAIALEIGRPDRAVSIYSRMAGILVDSRVPVREALERCLGYLDRASGHRQLQAAILLPIGELEARSGVGDRWRRHFDAAKAIIDDLDLRWPQGAAAYPARLGLAELAAGEPNRVVELLRQSCSTLDRLGDLGRLASLAPLTARVLQAVGLPDEVERYALWGRDIVLPEDLDGQAQWRIALSGLRSQQGRHDEAVALARESVEVVAASDMLVMQATTYETLGNALRAAGDEAEATAAAREAERLAIAKGDRAALRKITKFLQTG